MRMSKRAQKQKKQKKTITQVLNQAHPDLKHLTQKENK